MEDSPDAVPGLEYILKNRNNWNLASDANLLKYLQSVSAKIINGAQTTLFELDCFDNDINDVRTGVNNINNKLLALSDSQFLENRVKEEQIEIPDNTVSTERVVDEKDTSVKLKQALDSGIRLLNTQYRVIQVAASDSESDMEDETGEVLLKAHNPYQNRKLPYLIGTEYFMNDDQVGLGSTSAEETEEEDEEDEIENVNKESAAAEFVKTLPSKKSLNDGISISISESESEASASSDDPGNQITNVNKQHSENVHSVRGRPTELTFADQLRERINNFSSPLSPPSSYSPTVPPQVDDMFSPPPISRKDDTESDDSYSGSVENDLFTNTSISSGNRVAGSKHFVDTLWNSASPLYRQVDENISNIHDTHPPELPIEKTDDSLAIDKSSAAAKNPRLFNESTENAEDVRSSFAGKPSSLFDGRDNDDDYYRNIGEADSKRKQSNEETSEKSVAESVQKQKPFKASFMDELFSKLNVESSNKSSDKPNTTTAADATTTTTTTTTTAKRDERHFENDYNSNQDDNNLFKGGGVVPHKPPLNIRKDDVGRKVVMMPPPKIKDDIFEDDLFKSVIKTTKSHDKKPIIDDYYNVSDSLSGGDKSGKKSSINHPNVAAKSSVANKRTLDLFDDSTSSSEDDLFAITKHSKSKQLLLPPRSVQKSETNNSSNNNKNRKIIDAKSSLFEDDESENSDLFDITKISARNKRLSDDGNHRSRNIENAEVVEKNKEIIQKKPEDHFSKQDDRKSTLTTSPFSTAPPPLISRQRENHKNTSSKVSSSLFDDDDDDDDNQQFLVKSKNYENNIVIAGNNHANIPSSSSGKNNIIDNVNNFKNNVTNNIPTNNAIDKIIPTNSVIDKTIPTNSVIDKIIPTNNVIDKTIPTNNVIDKIIPTNNVIDKIIPTNSVIDKTIPTNNVIDKTIPTNNVVIDKIIPTNNVIDKIIPTNNVIDKIIPTNSVIDKTIPTKSVIDKIISKNNADNNNIISKNENKVIKSAPLLPVATSALIKDRLFSDKENDDLFATQPSEIIVNSDSNRSNDENKNSSHDIVTGDDESSFIMGKVSPPPAHREFEKPASSSLMTSPNEEKKSETTKSEADVNASSSHQSDCIKQKTRKDDEKIWSTANLKESNIILPSPPSNKAELVESPTLSADSLDDNGHRSTSGGNQSGKNITSPKRAPGKLNPSLGININVNALLPNAKRTTAAITKKEIESPSELSQPEMVENIQTTLPKNSSKSLSTSPEDTLKFETSSAATNYTGTMKREIETKSTEELSKNERESFNSSNEILPTEVQSTTVLSSCTKTRAKLPSKRRPPTRRPYSTIVTGSVSLIDQLQPDMLERSNENTAFSTNDENTSSVHHKPPSKDVTKQRPISYYGDSLQKLVREDTSISNKAEGDAADKKITFDKNKVVDIVAKEIEVAPPPPPPIDNRRNSIVSSAVVPSVSEITTSSSVVRTDATIDSTVKNTSSKKITTEVAATSIPRIHREPQIVDVLGSSDKPPVVKNEPVKIERKITTEKKQSIEKVDNKKSTFNFDNLFDDDDDDSEDDDIDDLFKSLQITRSNSSKLSEEVSKTSVLSSTNKQPSKERRQKESTVINSTLSSPRTPNELFPTTLTSQTESKPVTIVSESGNRVDSNGKGIVKPGFPVTPVDTISVRNSQTTTYTESASANTDTSAKSVDSQKVDNLFKPARVRSKSFFGDEEDDDLLFSSSKIGTVKSIAAENQRQSSIIEKKTAVTDKISKPTEIASDRKEKLLVPDQNRQTERKLNIFDEDEDDADIFGSSSSMKRKSKPETITGKQANRASVFDDDDPDDFNQLFNKKSVVAASGSSGGARKNDPTQKQTTKTRIVKLQSKTVENNPLFCDRPLKKGDLFD